MNIHRLVQLIVCLALFPVVSISAGGFDDHFEDATLRVDFYQYGNAEVEHMAVDRLIKQGRWAGPVDHLIDPHPYGHYIVRVSDVDGGGTLFERGFDSYFGEYRMTGPAREGVARVYHETVLLPFPRHQIRIGLSARPIDGPETLLVEFTVDPTAVEIAWERPKQGVTVVDGHIAGDSHECLDIAFVGEGYNEMEVETFRADVKRFTKLMLSQEPYASSKDHINIRGVLLPSLESGVDEPTKGVWRATALGASFYSFGSPRYLLTEANRSVRDVAANVPYDTLVIMVNHDRYGGGGLYDRYCAFTAHGPFAGYLLLHEFGHSFGGLADEYYTSSTAYNDFYTKDVEPIAPNITALLDPDNLKWADLLTPNTQLPTPWDKTGYDKADLAYQGERRELNAEIAEAARSGASTAEIERLQKAEDRHALDRAAAVDAFMETSSLGATVGAFEGAGYVSEGLYRPAIDCLMFSRGVKDLCPVCRRAVQARISVYTGE
jgi:hypothetical protein